MIYRLTIEGRFPSLNQFIDANRIGKGKWNKGNKMKRDSEHDISVFILEQLKGVKIDLPVIIKYTFYEPNKKRDLDNISGYFHKVFQDSLVRCGVIQNDSWHYITGFTDSFEVDNARPRIEVEIMEVENGRKRKTNAGRKGVSVHAKP